MTVATFIFVSSNYIADNNILGKAGYFLSLSPYLINHMRISFDSALM